MVEIILLPSSWHLPDLPTCSKLVPKTHMRYRFSLLLNLIKKKSVGLPLLGAKTYSFKHVQTQRLSTPNGRVFERIEWVKQKYQAPPPRA